MSSRHAPGPWVVTEFRCTDGSPTPGVFSKSAGCAVAWPHGRNDLEQIANARLIANAPRMLEACEFMLAHAFERKWQGDERAYDMLHAILRGIKGDGNG